MRVEVCCVGIAYQFTTVYPASSTGLNYRPLFLCYISPVSLTSGVIGVLDTDNEMGSYNMFFSS
jgi:hypothetical protein